MKEARMDTYFRQRLQRRLYNGDWPNLDMPSLPLTELAVEYFHDSVPDTLGRVDLFSASNVIRCNRVSPCSVVLSMLYAKRLRQQKQPQKQLPQSMSSADIFFISVMMASKYLYDEGVEEEVFNDEWADNTDQAVEDVNRMEIEFLQAIDWKMFVHPHEFEDTVAAIERRLALQEGCKRGWFTYTELDVLMNSDLLRMLWANVGLECSKLLTAISAAYVASMVSLMGSAVLGIQISGQLSSMTLAMLTFPSSPLTPVVYPELSAHTWNVSCTCLMCLSPVIGFANTHQNEAPTNTPWPWALDNSVCRNPSGHLDSCYKLPAAIASHRNGCQREQSEDYCGEHTSCTCKKSSTWLLWFVDTLLSQIWAAICVSARQAKYYMTSSQETRNGHKVSGYESVAERRKKHEPAFAHQLHRRSLSSNILSHKVDGVMELSVETHELLPAHLCVCSCTSLDAMFSGHYNTVVCHQILDMQTMDLLSQKPCQPKHPVIGDCHDNCLNLYSCVDVRSQHRKKHITSHTHYPESLQNVPVDCQFPQQHQTNYFGMPNAFVTSA